MTFPRRRAGGRPKRAEAPRRLERLLAIAERHFLAGGYSETSLESIARDAGVAKKTLYRHFGGKDGLFVTIYEALRNSWIDELANIAISSKDPATVLEAVALRLLDVATRPETVELQRLLLTEAHRCPAARSNYGPDGALCGMAPLARYLRTAARERRIKVADVALATEQFTFLVLGGVRERLLSGAGPRPGARERHRIARQAVLLFLNGALAQRRKSERPQTRSALARPRTAASRNPMAHRE